MNVLIVGCGRVGGFLAGLLAGSGNAVTVVDLERHAFEEHLPRDFNGATILGNGTDLDTLRQAGIDKADAFLALTQGDNRNVMAAQVAREMFRVERVIAKVNDPIRAEMYRNRGIQTFSRTTILGALLDAMLKNETEVGEILMQRSLAHDRTLAGSIPGARA